VPAEPIAAPPSLFAVAPSTDVGPAQPTFDQPVFSQPAATESVFGQPASRQPALSQPVVSQPVAHPPVEQEQVVATPAVPVLGAAQSLRRRPRRSRTARVGATATPPTSAAC